MVEITFRARSMERRLVEISQGDETAKPEAATVDVSVVICVRNGAETILKQLSALDNQADHPPFEVVVVDNGSTDQTCAIVNSWIAGGPRAAARARLVDGGTKPGIPPVRNTGIRHAAGRVVAFCDADDEVDSAWVGEMARGVPSGGMAGGRILGRLPDGTPRLDAFPEGLNTSPFLPWVAGCNVALTKECLASIGGYDESLPRYGFEDVDISWRAQLAGHPLKYVPGAKVHMTLPAPRTAVRKRFLLGIGRILIADRYPQYDGRHYSLRTCAGDVFSALAEIPGGLRSRSQLSPAISDVATSSGRFVGYFRYHVFGRTPDPILPTMAD